MPAPKHLTEQQRKFAQGVATHGSYKRAAEEAGYAHAAHVVTRLSKNPRVAEEIARLQSEVAKASDPAVIADAQEIQAFLTRTMRGQEPDFSLSLSGDVVEGAAKLETRRKAAMDLAKLQGLVRDKLEHTGADGRPIELAAFQGMSESELRARAAKALEAGKGGKGGK